MDLAGWRDIALVIIGLLNAVIALIVLVITFLLWRYSRKGVHAVEKLLTERVRPLLDAVEARAAVARDYTARLPGNPRPEGELPSAAASRLPSLRLPFRRKKRRRLPFLPS